MIDVRADHDILRIGQTACPKSAVRTEVLVNNCDPPARSSIKVMNFLSMSSRRAVIRQGVVRDGGIAPREGVEGAIVDALSKLAVIEKGTQFPDVGTELSHGDEA